MNCEGYQGHSPWRKKYNFWIRTVSHWELCRKFWRLTNCSGHLKSEKIPNQPRCKIVSTEENTVSQTLSQSRDETFTDVLQQISPQRNQSTAVYDSASNIRLTRKGPQINHSDFKHFEMCYNNWIKFRYVFFVDLRDENHLLSSFSKARFLSISQRKYNV